MKYIDAEKLIAEIKRHISHYEKLNRDEFKNGELYICQELLSFIKSLQQEQPEPTCKSCGFYENNCPFIRNTFKPYPNKICKDYTYSVMKKQGQPEVDLKKVYDAYCKVCGHYHHTTPAYICRHACDYFKDFEALLNARKEDDK